MRFIAAWEQGDALSCHVCLMLSPHDWKELQAVHRQVSRRLDEAEARWLFAQRLKGRTDATAALGCAPLPREGDLLSSMGQILALASAVETAGEVFDDVVTYPRLVSPDMPHVRQVLARLHWLTVKDRQMMPRERSGRRSALPRRLLRSFASFNSLLPRLVALIIAFPAGRMPPSIFVLACEVVAGLIHNAKESKKTFVGSGGLEALLNSLRNHPRDAAMQAAGLAALLALSARSVSCIRSMADVGAHEVSASALKRFPNDVRIVGWGAGLLANMSNVPCVRPKLQRCGILTFAHTFLAEEKVRDLEIQESSRHHVNEFVQYLMKNLQENDGSP